MGAPGIDLSFPHRWRAEILAGRPLILPPRHFVYPQDVEEVERGALEIMVHPEGAGGADAMSEPFLATCGLGFRDPSVPTGIWACPREQELCAVSGGYAYVIDTLDPERRRMIEYRPVFEVRAAVSDGLLLFAGSRTILAWGVNGIAWESGKLSDEGVSIAGIEPGVLRGRGWDMESDEETAFALDLASGALAEP